MKNFHRNSLVLLCLALLFLQAGFVLPRGWHGITPLRTTRAQVERLLGSPRMVGSVPTYYVEDETVQLLYSKYSCGDPRNLEKWNVPPNTVISIRVIPKRRLRLADLHFDLSKFRKERIPFDFPCDYSHLVNDEEGLTLSLVSFGKDFVDSYTYGPRASDRPLLCPDYSAEEESRMRDCIPLSFRVSCSSQDIRLGSPVECRFRSQASENAPITLKWIVSPGASQSSGIGKSVRVSLTDTKKPRIKVTVRVVSPKVCFDTASVELPVVKSKKRIRLERH